MKLKICVFYDNSNAGKAKLNKLYLLTLISVIEKMQLSDFDIKLWQIISGNLCQILSELSSFYKRYDKKFWYVFSVHSCNSVHLQKDMTQKLVFFRFTVLTVHLQNANAKFHKVG